jgi:hypothetical protein
LGQNKSNYGTKQDEFFGTGGGKLGTCKAKFGTKLVDFLGQKRLILRNNEMYYGIK